MEVDHVTEEELAEFLTDEPDFFMRALYEYYHKPIMACIEKASYGVLDEEELADVFQESMLAVWTKVQEPDFEPDRPLRMVFRIVKNKAIDARRRKLRISRPKNAADITDFVIEDMKDSQLSVELRLTNEEQRRLFRQALPEILAKLSERQRAAAVAFFECFAEIRANDKYRPVADAMSAITGRNETVVTAKSALRNALEKIRGELVKREISFLEEREI